jgi:hypothetical protein
VNEAERVRWARACTSTGWLFLTAYLLIVIAQFRRAFAIRQSSFEDGVWGQRAENVAFVALPQNLVILAPAAAAAVIAMALTRSAEMAPVPWAPQLVRLVAGTGYLAIGLALLGVIDQFAQSPDLLGGTVLLLNRIAGILMALAMIRVCLESERASTR